MATQTGVVVEAVGQPYTVARDVERPKPGPNQVLVRTLAVGINPVETMMKNMGILVVKWPAVFGSEACGVVVECGEGVTKLKVGDEVYGCTLLGRSEYSAFQDCFLAYEDLVFKSTTGITPAQACTLGASLETAALCLLAGMDMTLPQEGAEPAAKDEWVVVLGGSGNVGQYGVQLARLCGYKVLATCSPSKDSVVRGEKGAHATVNNRASEDEQLSKIREVTGGNFSRVFDASAFGYAVGIKALETVSTSDKKWFSTVDSWSEHNTPSSVKEYRVNLGLLGAFDNPTGREVTEHVRNLIPRLEQFIQRGDLWPLDLELVDGLGWDKVIEGLSLFESGKASKKVVVRIAEK